MTDRAVSTTLNYTLTLGISAILIVGLLTVGGNFVESQRNGVVDSELEVIGERLAGDIHTADRLVQADNETTTVTVTSRLPRRVSGSSYDIEVVTSDGNATLELTSDAIDRTVTTRVPNTTAISSTTVRGGTLEIVYNQSGSNDRLEVTDA
jgi:hypothetical protein